MSIIIPCYNAAHFIKNTVTMFEGQDIKNCEIIVVNDGSRDNTLDIAKELEKKYNNIFVINQKNRGVSSARNKGLSYAKGEYIYFFDSDDRIEDNTLSFYKKVFQRKPECDIYAFGYQMSRNGNVIRRYASRKAKTFIMSGKTVLERILYGKLYFNICGCIFKKSFLDFYNLTFKEGITIGEDGDFIRRCLVRAKTVYYNSRISFTYQLRSESSTSGNTYTLQTFDSFDYTLDSIDDLKKYVNPCACNFFSASRYVDQILRYLKSDLKNKRIETGLKNYRYLVYRKMRIGNLKWAGAIIFVRVVPWKYIWN